MAVANAYFPFSALSLPHQSPFPWPSPICSGCLTCKPPAPTSNLDAKKPIGTGLPDWTLSLPTNILC